MTENQNTTTQQNQPQEGFDIKALLFRFWAKRRFILIVAGIFTILGLVAALCQKPKYVSTCTFVPQFASPMQAMPFYSVPALMPDTQTLTAILSGETLSPLVYPQILNNTIKDRLPINIEIIMNRVLAFCVFNQKCTLNVLHQSHCSKIV